MPNGFHTHNYNGVTSINNRHDHRYSGRTGREPDTMGHTHVMEGNTTTDSGHSHFYQIRTGPAIYRNGDHYHSYQGDTDMAFMHIHSMNGYTSLE
jgi:hypothetical protein